MSSSARHNRAGGFMKSPGSTIRLIAFEQTAIFVAEFNPEIKGKLVVALAANILSWCHTFSPQSKGAVRGPCGILCRRNGNAFINTHEYLFVQAEELFNVCEALIMEGKQKWKFRLFPHKDSQAAALKIMAEALRMAQRWKERYVKYHCDYSLPEEYGKLWDSFDRYLVS